MSAARGQHYAGKLDDSRGMFCFVFRNFTAVRPDTQGYKFTVRHVLHVTSEPWIIFHASIQICDRQASSQGMLEIR